MMHYNATEKMNIVTKSSDNLLKYALFGTFGFICHSLPSNGIFDHKCHFLYDLTQIIQKRNN